MQELKDAIVERRAAQFSFLRDLVRADTAIDNDAPIKSIERIAAMLELLGFAAEVYDVPEEKSAALGRPPMSNLVVREKHADGKMFGRGVLSGKGHLAAQVFALLALRDVGAKLKGSTELHISFDGERGGTLGAKWMIAEGIAQPDYAIVGGPARGLVLQSAGSMSMTVDVTGQASPMFGPDSGADATDAATQALTRLFQFRTGFMTRKSSIPGIGQATMTIDSIMGGQPGGGVPEKVSFSLNLKMLPDEDPKKVEAQLTNLIGGTVARVQGARCRIRRTRLIPPMTINRDAEPLYNVLKKEIASTTGFQPKNVGVSYEHEGRHYSAADVPTVMYGAGPLDPFANGMLGPDEMLDLDDLRTATQVLAQSMNVYLDRARV